MRLATWNVNSVIARRPRLEEWLDLAEPDVVCLQEIKCTAESFPSDGVEARGYELAVHGEGRWNGVAILSRVGLDDVSLGFPGQPAYAPPVPDEEGALLSPAEAAGGAATGTLEARAVGATCGGVRIWSVYVPNGRTLDSPHYSYKLAWLDAFREALVAELGRYEALVATGDFNIIPTEADVWNPRAFIGSTHVSPAERERLAALLALGLTDVLPRAMKYDTPYTYWDYRAGAFHQNRGMRIDLVYATSAVAAAVSDAYVDRDARKGTGPSDHAPVVVDVNIPG